MGKQFAEPDLAAFQKLRCAFDPHGLANPGKVMPTPRLCGEVPGPYRRHPLEEAGRCRALLRRSPSGCRQGPARIAGARHARRGAGRSTPSRSRRIGLTRSSPRAGGLHRRAAGRRARSSDAQAAVRRGRPDARARPARATGRSAACSRPPTPARCATATARRATSIIGVELALADGTVARGGGRVIKNVAGYDLPKLAAGSFGTLGVITEVCGAAAPAARSRSRPPSSAATPTTLQRTRSSCARQPAGGRGAGRALGWH